MVFLNTTITFSVAIMPVLYLLSVITVGLIFVVINFLFYNKLENITRGDFSPDMNIKQHRIFIGFGIILIPLFKRTIKEGFYVRNLNWRLDRLNRGMMMDSGVDINEMSGELKQLQRSIKLSQLKYNKKNFVIRKIFSIFVEE